MMETCRDFMIRKNYLLELLEGGTGIPATKLEVSKQLDQIHGFFDRNDSASFLYGAAEQALTQSADLLAYYGKVKSLVLRSWLTQAKGIAILELAYARSDPVWDAGKDSIRRHHEQLNEAAKNVRQVIGPDCVDLAEAILTNPKGKTDVKIFAKHGWQVIDEYNKPFILQNGSVSEYTSWDLEPMVSLENSEIATGSKYPLYWNLKNRKGGLTKRVYLHPHDNATYGPGDQCGWLIKPYHPGPSKLTFEFFTTYTDHYIPRFNGHFLDLREPHTNYKKITNIDHIGASNLGTFWEVKVHKSVA